MNITNVHIKNVRGIGDESFELKVFSNKPNIIVASNGCGKSSFAVAFDWLKPKKIQMDKADAYMGIDTNKPELTITLKEENNPEEKLTATENSNQINKRFDVFVIKAGLKTTVTGKPNQRKTSYISGSQITILKNCPKDTTQLSDDFAEVNQLDGAPKGTFPVINALLSNHSFMSTLDIRLLKLNSGKPLLKDFYDWAKEDKGSKKNRHAHIREQWMDTIIQRIKPIQYAMEQIQKLNNGEDELLCFLKAVSLVDVSDRKRDEVKQRIKYSNYILKEESTRTLFKSLRSTWLHIQPHREGKDFFLKIDHAQRISNGERDMLNFTADLERVKYAIGKKDVILVIDEVFDYLDDAHMMAAQYYITLFIESLKKQHNIFPVIMTHINPTYFRSYYFQDMKISYLKRLVHPKAKQDIVNLVKERDRMKKEEPDHYKTLSNYMFHFHPDKTYDLTGIDNLPRKEWVHLDKFKSYCAKELKAYLNANDLAQQDYDALGVSLALREMIEEYAYTKLGNDDLRNEFLIQKSTKKKLLFAEENGVKDIPTVFSLLGLVYNEPMHNDGSKNQIDICHTLFSRLENETVRTMIREVKTAYERLMLKPIV